MKVQINHNLLFLGILTTFILIFNWQLVQELVNTPMEIFSSDGAITEYIVENSYQKLLAGENPFTHTETIFYPFGANYSLNDPGLGVLPYYAILRTMMGVHQAMLVVLLINFALICLSMYALLEYLKISWVSSVVISVIFTTTPFVTERLIGHYIYISTFIFPLTTLVFIKFINTKEYVQKLLFASLLGLVFAWALYLSFYYFIMLVLGVGFYSGYFIITKSRETWVWVRNNWRYGLLTGAVMTMVLAPWITGVKAYLLNENREQVQGFGGAIDYSVELPQFIIPSENNPVYHFIRNKIGIERAWERTVYPGLVLLSIVGYLLFRWKYIPSRIKKQMQPFLWGSLFFAILTLGPFLKLRGSIELANLEGVSVVFPLPFLLLHYIPGLESLRVPGRFAPAYIFFLAIAGGYLLDYLIKRKKWNKHLLLIMLLGIILVDQFYRLPKPVTTPIPTSLYQKINEDSSNSTVLEIPFTVRDGFRYLGFVHAISPMQGTLIHNKPILGGYLARVSDEVVNYYANLKTLGYILNITDRGNYDPIYEDPGEAKIYPYPYSTEETNRELDFLRVKHILIKSNEPYTETVKDVIKLANGRLIDTNDGYEHYVRELKENEEQRVELGSDYDDYLSVAGGTVTNTDSRTIVLPEAKLLFSSEGGKKNIFIKMESITTREIALYVNGGKIKIVNVGEKEEYMFPNVETKEGVNILMIKINNLENNEVLTAESGIMIFALGVVK